MSLVVGFARSTGAERPVYAVLSTFERTLVLLEKRLSRFSLRVHAAAVALDPEMPALIEQARREAQDDWGVTATDLRLSLADRLKARA